MGGAKGGGSELIERKRRRVGRRRREARPRGIGWGSADTQTRLALLTKMGGRVGSGWGWVGWVGGGGLRWTGALRGWPLLR